MRTSFDSKKRKIITRRNQQQDDLSRKSSFRENTSNVFADFKKPENSVESLRKALEQISSSLTEEKEIRLELEQKVTKLYERGIQRETQLQRLLQQTLPFCNQQRPLKVSSNSLKQVQKQLLQFFNKTNEMANQKITEQTDELEGIMQRKIRNITSYMEQELEKSKRLLKLNYETIRKQINRILELGTAILDDNQALRKQVDALKFKNTLLKEEKDMLIVQVLEKKSIINQMYKQLKQKYRKDDLLDEEIGIIKRQREQIQKQYERYEKEIRKKTSKEGLNYKHIQPKSILAFGVENSRNAEINQCASAKKKSTIQREDTYYSSTITKPNIKKQPHRMFTTIDTQKRTTASRVSSVANNKSQSLSQSRVCDQKSQKINRMISSLKRQLQNQRKKSSEQVKKLNKYQLYQKQMESILGEKLVQKQQSKGNTQQLKNHGNIIKITQIVRELGRRMLSTANPSVNSGYHDFQSLLQQIQEETVTMQ